MRLSPNHWRIALALIILIAVIALHQSGVFAHLDLATLKARQVELEGWIAARPVLASCGFFILYVLVAAASIPGAAVLTLAAGALFGVVHGLLLVSFASTIGATLAFLVARFVLREALRSRYRNRLERIDRGVERDGGFYLFTLRLVPVFPFFVINLLAGLTALKTGTFYWVSQLGMLPGTLAYVYAGTQIARIETPADVLSPSLISAFIVLGTLPLLTRWLARLIAAKRVYRSFERPAKFDYNLVVIGAGSAGLVSAYIAAAVKAKVALIEKDRMGGDCLNTGCVPSKALIRTARLLADARNSERFGIRELNAYFEFSQVMERVQKVIRKVEPHDSPARYRDLGVDVIEGEATLLSPWEVRVGERILTTRSVIVASGARPLVPPIPGLDEVPYLTSENLWHIRTLPRRLVVLGGGPIGCELAQCFGRLGAKVTLVEMVSRLLPREDADASGLLTRQLVAEGLTVATSHKAVRVEATANGGTLVCEHDGAEVRIPFDRILIALGRKANVEGFGLEEVGVRVNDRGTVEADGFLRTNIPNILVAGDVTGPWQFTHVASHQAWYASVNALLAPFWSFRADNRVIPWATFTDPEVARVGLSEDEAAERGINVEVTRYGIDDLDRAIADSADYGLVKVLTPPGKDRVLGATIVGAHAGELIHEFVLAMKHGLGLNKLLGTIHVYPTMSEANKYAAGAWKREHAPQAALALAGRFFAWRLR
jgi:pyruvate/2-oxoglutarate dehydrogenase complex dihydrolipoamide dehydrogenase (E3) component/uncharacterized membrane protein YdjX (TVP38/TMEM64 family)